MDVNKKIHTHIQTRNITCCVSSQPCLRKGAAEWTFNESRRPAVGCVLHSGPKLDSGRLKGVLSGTGNSRALAIMEWAVSECNGVTSWRSSSPGTWPVITGQAHWQLGMSSAFSLPSLPALEKIISPVEFVFWDCLCSFLKVVENLAGIFWPADSSEARSVVLNAHARPYLVANQTRLPPPLPSCQNYASFTAQHKEVHLCTRHTHTLRQQQNSEIFHLAGFMYEAMTWSTVL